MEAKINVELTEAQAHGLLMSAYFETQTFRDQLSRHARADQRNWAMIETIVKTLTSLRHARKAIRKSLFNE